MTQQDSYSEQEPSRFVVGIDLGTTNSAVSFVDTECASWKVETFKIPQLVSTGQVESRDTLPSFHYQPTKSESTGGALRLPWQSTDPKHIVGVMAREQGALAPGRLIASSKSWLCHAGVDRTADLLPWHGADDIERLSPVAAGARILQHIKEAWDDQHQSQPLSEQDVILTLPASFDEVARELTVEAAKQAGIPRVVLIEEPQAAFYSWVHAHHDDWQTKVKPGQRILVCDVGGGTSDFTLIHVRKDDSSDAEVQFHRIAVGEHLILGGDNLDLALAHYLEGKFRDQGTKLSPRQWDMLVRNCRGIKELFLGDSPPDRQTVHIAGGGAKLIGGGVKTEITRGEVEEILVDGFHPRVALDEKPQTGASGFQEFGLPYAADPAITRYLAAFLTAHRDVDRAPFGIDHDPARPDLVLFNGGLFESTQIKQRVVEIISSWFSDPNRSWQPELLEKRTSGFGRRAGRGVLRNGSTRRRSANRCRPRSFLLSRS